MLVIPAIDILDGKAVRLYQGNYDLPQTYDADPVAAAQRLADSGVVRIHVVDLDAARGKGKHNRDLVTAIRKATNCQIEVGGGIRSPDDIRQLNDAGADWLIVGTALVKQPEEVKQWIADFPGRFIAGIDARDGRVKVSGWEDDAMIEDTHLALSAARMGFSAIIYTNISRDGTLEGPDLERTNEIARVTGIPVILSGGIGSMEDIERAVTQAHPMLQGIITGKALYEGRLDLRVLCARYPQPTGIKQ